VWCTLSLLGGREEETRKRERGKLGVRRIVERLYIRDYYLIDFTYTRLYEHFNGVKYVLDYFINRFKPDRIYTNSLNDVHQNHYVVAYATLVAGRRVRQVLHYWSTTTNNIFHPIYFIGIIGVVERKLELLGFFAFQVNRDYLKKAGCRECKHVLWLSSGGRVC